MAEPVPLSGRAAAPPSDLAGVLALLGAGDIAGAVEGAARLPPHEGEAVRALARALNERFVVAARAVSGTVLTGATQLLASEDLAQETRRQAEDIARLSGAAEGLTASFAEVARAVDAASAGARDSLRQVAIGRERVQGALGALRDLSATFAEVQERVRALEAEVGQVESVLDVIRRVADQTHLLAFNATIEAARAGEAGRGFAVVAAEVRRLSESARRALRQASGTVERIRQGTGELVAVAAGVARRAAEEATRADEAEEALRQIAAITEKAADELGRVARVTGEQARAVDDMAAALQGVSASTARIEELAGTVAGAVAALQRQMAGARKLLTRMSLTLTDDDVLELAKADHLLWTHRLHNLLAGRDRLRPDQILDPGACRLGRWLESCGPAFRTRDAFARLRVVHVRIHEVPRALIAAWNAGRKAEARRLFDEVRTLSEELLALLGELQAAATPGSPPAGTGIAPAR